MKTLLTLVMALSLSQAYGQMSGTPAPSTGVPAAGTSSMPGMLNNNNPNMNRPADRATGIRRSNTMNNTNTTTDTIGTSQSSTTRGVLPNTPGTITPPNLNATGVNCVDRSGRTYGNNDAGYTACVNSMRTR
ncbi:hypothetical protein SHI21_15175 [Bacteriovorax sp. PP10]|uniref:Uncharacterized protein n=1 Tax=Bacteriovorax antarcticus TaxID=3088717 RepID=A0ABU5VZ19_9BACT|nr:hypothetical protein [Bacteriovorax sp. PP10]MEA9357569.1 hypothetical protein [Bacteriovorax sp. PP10]